MFSLKFLARTFLAPCAVAIGLFGASTSIDAAPITFFHEGSFDGGTLNGQAIGPHTFRITATGDTNNRTTFFEGYFIDHGSAHIDIFGLGTLSFIPPTRTFVNNVTQTVGFSGAGITGITRADLFNGPTNGAFAAWDMLSSIGPIGGAGEVLQWGLSPINTSGGILFLDNSFTDAEFKATVIPLPSGGLLLLTALSVGGIAVRRRKRR